jgi:hypothetical protein
MQAWIVLLDQSASDCRQILFKFFMINSIEILALAVRPVCEFFVCLSKVSQST